MRNPNLSSKVTKILHPEKKRKKNRRHKNIDLRPLFYVFHIFSLLAVKFGNFKPQIRIPHEQLYIWQAGNVWRPKSESKHKEIAKCVYTVSSFLIVLVSNCPRLFPINSYYFLVFPINSYFFLGFLIK